MDLIKLCTEVCKLTSEVREFILEERKKFQASSIEKKGHNDLVSYVDKTSEQKLITRLKELLPESGFIAEENTESKKGDRYNWIIDPLDGTTNFIHGLPCFCISIGLMDNNNLVLGVVHELNFDECFYACKNNGAFMNGRPIKVSDIRSLNDSLLATGFPYHDYDRMKPYMEVFDWCMRNTHGLRRLGSAAADLAYVACGRFESFYEYGLNPWDVAGGAFIVQEAGGMVTDFKGGSDFIFGAEIIASNAHVGNAMLNVVQEKFSN